MVARGAKPTAEVEIPRRALRGVRAIARGYGLRCYVVPLDSGTHMLVYVYRPQHRHIPRIITAIRSVTDLTVHHWMRGKLFGYSEDAIAEFIGRVSIKDARR